MCVFKRLDGCPVQLCLGHQVLHFKGCFTLFFAFFFHGVQLLDAFFKRFIQPCIRFHIRFGCLEFLCLLPAFPGDAIQLVEVRRKLPCAPDQGKGCFHFLHASFFILEGCILLQCFIKLGEMAHQGSFLLVDFTEFIAFLFLLPGRLHRLLQ